MMLSEDMKKALDMAIKALEQEPCEDAISRQAVDVRLEEIINEMETIFADIREKNVDDSVCGLCEYDCDHGIDGSSFECLGFEKDDCFKLKDKYRKQWTNTEALPPVKPQPKTGHWIEIDEEPHEAWECDHCGFVIDGSGCIDPYDYRDTYRFCPNCGCRMFEPQERSD